MRQQRRTPSPRPPRHREPVASALRAPSLDPPRRNDPLRYRRRATCSGANEPAASSPARNPRPHRRMARQSSSCTASRNSSAEAARQPARSAMPQPRRPSGGEWNAPVEPGTAQYTDRSRAMLRKPRARRRWHPRVRADPAMPKRQGTVGTPLRSSPRTATIQPPLARCISPPRSITSHSATSGLVREVLRTTWRDEYI